MKSYTDLEQSKQLVEFLPLESADMWWNFYSVTTDDTTPQIIHLDTPWVGSFNWDNKPDNVSCWSLAALMDVLPYPHLEQNYKGKWCCRTEYADTTYLWEADNPVDACYEMIIKLNELNLL